MFLVSWKLLFQLKKKTVNSGVKCSKIRFMLGKPEILMCSAMMMGKATQRNPAGAGRGEGTVKSLHRLLNSVPKGP